jgi:catechol 2,3-dioxygenase-like lactoylglutathione lyase family enzyme
VRRRPSPPRTWTAREFYGGTLGLRAIESPLPGPDLVFECGATRLIVYERAAPATPPAHTLVHFEVEDVRAQVDALRGRGVVFEDYDLPSLRTVDGVASLGDRSAAWFRDSDGNILGLHD